MICPYCQSENRDGAKFCNECGLPLSGKIAEVAAATNAAEAAEQEVSEFVIESETPPVSSDFETEAFEADVNNHVDGDNDVTKKSPAHASVDRLGPSGPLDPSTLPTIDVVGVNVDEDGNAFDFSPIEDENGNAVDFDPIEDENGNAVDFDPIEDEKDDDKDPSTPIPPHQSALENDPDITTDPSEADECLVDADYTPPKSSWRTGGTMEMPRVDDQDSDQQKEFRAPDAHEKKHGKGKIIAIVLICLIVLGVGVAGGTYYLELWGGKVLPNVVDMTQADATFVLEGKDFTVRSTQVKSDETEGVVLLMDPGAGTRLEAGSEVVIHVATARTIPEVLGVQRDEVANLLKESGFENVTIVTQKSDEHEGAVLAIEPAAGMKAKALTPITVTVAVPYTVPDITGMNWDNAVAALEAEGLVAQFAYIYDDSVAENTLLGTDPVGGTKVTSGSTVTVNVAKSRKAELETAAWAYLNGLIGNTIELGGASYVVESVNEVTYQGNESTAFTITGPAVTTLDGETVRSSSKPRNGTIVWDSANNIVSIS